MTYKGVILCSTISLYGWNLAVTCVSLVYSRHTAIANKVCSDSTRSEQVETSVYCINFDGSSANVTLFISRNILLFWKVCI